MLAAPQPIARDRRWRSPQATRHLGRGPGADAQRCPGADPSRSRRTPSKLFPGLLLVYLIVRRQWRAVAWTAAMGALLVVLSLAVVGGRQYVAFADHLPGLLSGEAFPAFRNPSAMAINFSIPGLVFKLKVLGLGGLSFGASKMIGWLYTLMLLAVVVMVSRRPRPDHDKPALWLAILILASLRSPFLPQAYAAFPPLWLLTLLAARQPPTARRCS